MDGEMRRLRIKGFILIFLLVGVLVPIVMAPIVMAQSDEASVPKDRLPWSGHWWPLTQGELVFGYNEHPSPLEKYDAYVTGFYPAAAYAEGLVREYDPDAPGWFGHCDDWAAASVLELEPSLPGDLMGIPFAVGDKKGLLSAFYAGNVAAVYYGERYSEEGDDFDDVYPGGVNGFHQTLINYIANQGLPIIMDLEPGPQVWNHPVFRYEMEWFDQDHRRYVTCTVWMVSDNVTPDFVGTQEFTRTYTYSLEIDGMGELLDEPGQWEGASVDSHPDFMWFPTYVSTEHSYLDRDTIDEIVQSEADGSDDRFEWNNDVESAQEIEESIRDRFYWGSAQDEDWYKVALEAGDYFYAFLLSPSDDLDVQIFDADGYEEGTMFYHGSRIDSAAYSDFYYVRVRPTGDKKPYYNIEFYGSPSDVIPHVACKWGWNTTVTLLGEEWIQDQVRFNLFNEDKEIIAQNTLSLPEGKQLDVALDDLFPVTAAWGKSAKLINLDGNGSPNGFFSYSTDHQLANVPFRINAAQRLFVPNIRNMGEWWTGIVLMNRDVFYAASIGMISYDEDGAVIAETPLILGAGQNKVGFPEAFGEVPDGTAWVEFSSDRRVQGLVLWGVGVGNSDSGLGGIPLLREQHLSDTLFLAHLATYSGWVTEVAMINPNSETAHIEITGYSSDGSLGGTTALEIPPNGRWIGSVQELFNGNWSSGFVWAKIQSNQPLCGYQLFARGTNGLAALPLPSEQDGKTDFLVKYVPDMEYSWMGLVFLNTNEFKGDIWAAPYDGDGNNLLKDGFLWYNVPYGIGGYHNAVGFIEDMFPGLPSQTAYLKVYSEVPVLGFGLYEHVTGGQMDMLYLD
jgi:hypothetical protein